MKEQSGQFTKELKRKMLNKFKIRKEKSDLANNIKIVKEYKKAILNNIEKLNSKKRSGFLSNKEYELLINNFEGYHYKSWINHYDEYINYYNVQLQNLENQEKQSETQRWNNTFYISSVISIFWIFIFMSQLNITGFVSLVITTNSKTLFDQGQYNNTIFNTTSNAVQLNVGQTAGSYNSTVFNNPDLKWNAISWKPVAPYGKELPNNQGRDTGYQDGNINMNENVLLMHLNNQSIYGENDSYFRDLSIQNRNGTCDMANAKCPIINQSGKFGYAVSFDGIDDEINISENPVLLSRLPSVDSNRTISFWVNTIFKALHTPFGYKGGTGTGSDFLVDFNNDIGLDGISLKVNNGKRVWNASNLSDGIWHNIVISSNGSTSTSGYVLYKDGIEIPVDLTTNAILNTGKTYAYIGSRSGGSFFFNGSIDEFAVWNRTLSASEILDIYKRGAARLKLQVRSCDDSKCSGENYIGPNGSTNDYYNDSVDSSSSPFFYVNVTNNPYFQYQAVFETDNATALPALSSTTLDYGYFDKSIASARVNFTVATTVVVRFNTSYIDFGNGSLVYAPNLTTINTTDPDVNPSTFKDPGPLVIQNDGNVEVNLSIYSVTAANFIGGTNPTYQWNASENETGSCSGTNNLTSAITDFTATPATVCSNLTFQESSDALNIDVYLGIPADVRPGYRETLVNVTAQRYCSVLPC